MVLLTPTHGRGRSSALGLGPSRQTSRFQDDLSKAAQVPGFAKYLGRLFTLNLESDHPRHRSIALGSSRYQRVGHPLDISSRPTAGHLLSYPRQGRQQHKSQVLNTHRAALGAKAALQDGLWWGGPSPGVRIPPGNQSRKHA